MSIKYQFEHNEFYDWCRCHENCFVSERFMPEDFICVARIDKKVLYNQGTGAHEKKRTENLYIAKGSLENVGTAGTPATD